MNQRFGKLGLLLGCLAGLAAATCGGKVVVDQGSGNEGGSNTGGTGNTGTGNTGNTSTNNGGVGNAGPSQVSATNGPVASSVAATAVGVGVTGAGGASSCVSCSDVLQGNGDPQDLCPRSAPLFDAFVSCVCDFGCPMECQAACMNGQPGPECNDCLQTKCSQELQACFQD